MKNKTQRIALIALVVVGIGVVFAREQSKNAKPGSGCCATPPVFAALEPTKEPAIGTGTGVSPAATVSQKLPRLLDLGAGKCIPCKMMAPILEELKKEYAGRLEVQFIDVWKNPDAGKQYGVQMIPTQIFYAADGKELFRHAGFFGKADILAKWKELGVNLEANK